LESANPKEDGMTVRSFALSGSRAGFTLAVGLAAGLWFNLNIARAAAPAWKPEKAVEIIAVNAPGGGSDRIARIMAKVLQENRLIETPVNVVNKPGGGGSVAYAYLNQHPGDGHYVVLASKAILTNNLIGRGPSYTEFTPVANLFSEWISVTVKPDSPLKTGKDLIERLKKDPAALSFGIATSLGNLNHQGAAAAFKEAGIDVKKMRTVIFQSGGAATTAMLGGHIDIVPITAAFAASMVRNGQVRLIAVSSPQRLTGVLADVPTWRELGYDAVVSNWRSVIGPKAMTETQVAYWERALRRMVDSEEWKKELETNYWTNEYVGSAETRKYMERDNVQARAFLVDLGLAK
jgi:putative tricarboxylic transport membrane protein